MNPNAPEFLRLIESWDPRARPVHCANCRFAIVSGDGRTDPVVTCAQGHGLPRSLWQLTRSQRPIGFRAAAECPDFDSMDGVDHFADK